MASERVAKKRGSSARLVEDTIHHWWISAAITLLIVVLFGLLVWLYSSTRAPADNSAEAGFARDMAIHHAQAVEMAMIVRDRTDDDQIRILTTDILLTQQNQIGRMEGWLASWGLSLTGSQSPMAWMGHSVTGLMPGMATPEQVRALKTMPVDEMNVQFLQLMITHHLAGVDMAEAVLDRSDEPVVRQLADSIVKTQTSEVAAMEDILDRLGAPASSDEANPSDGAEHQH